MRKSLESALGARAERQHGVVAGAHLREIGCRPSQIRYMVRSGRLIVLARSVYRVAGTVVTWRQRLYAAICAAGTWGAASHRSAAALWDLPGASEDLVEVVCTRWRRKGSPDAYAHETYLQDKRDFTELDGIPVTSVARTLCDLGVSVRLGHIAAETLVGAIEEAIRRGLTSPEHLGKTWERLGGCRRPGGRELRAALERFLPKTMRSHSSAERELVHILEAAGYDDVVTQYHVVLPDGRDA